MLLIAAVTRILRKSDDSIRITQVSSAIKRFGIQLQLADNAAMSRQDKRQRNAERRLHIRRLRLATPERYHKLVDRIEGGSRAAADKLHCLQCADFCVAEVRHCGILDCAKWAFRPFQPKSK